MTRTLLDASALLAVIFEEPGADMVLSALKEGSSISAVNAAEVAACLFHEDWDSEEVLLAFNQLGVTVLPFDAEAAITSGSFHKATRKFGLGLGDRACLATAHKEKCPVLTADETWMRLDLPDMAVRCIR